jgi:hypothetical protein
MFVRKNRVDTTLSALQKTIALSVSAHQVLEPIRCQMWSAFLLKYVVQTLVIHLLFVKEHLQAINVAVLSDMWEILSRLVVAQKATAQVEILTAHLNQFV